MSVSKGAHLCHILAQLPQGQTQPLDKQSSVSVGKIHLSLQGGIPRGGQQAQQGAQQVGLGTQGLTPGVAVAHNCQDKGCLGAGSAWPVLLQIEVVDKVDVAVVLDQVLGARLILVL